MAQVSANYESVIVISTTIGEDGIKAMVEKITTLISQNGTLDSVNEWGKRRLAYPINDETEGYYVLFTFTSVPSFPAELDRIYKITEGLLRTLIVAKD